MRNVSRLLPLITCAVALLAATPSSAATAVWDCGADAAAVSLAGQTAVNPITTANRPCATHTSGLPDLAGSAGLTPAVSARTAYAVTSAQPAASKPIEQTVGSASGVEGLSLNAGGTIVIGVDAAQSQAAARCVSSRPQLGGSSTIAGLTINGTSVPLDSGLSQLTDALSKSLGAVLQIKLGEQLKSADGLVQRAAHITLLPQTGAAPLVDVIIAESRVTAAGACDPNADGNANTPTSPTTSGSSLPQVCASGSVLQASSGKCVIPASASGGQGTIIIGAPFTGPSGGSVWSLNKARAKYHSICLHGPGPAYAIIGTGKADRITGRNSDDRILSLAGNDRVDGGRGDDCIDGGTGADNLAGSLGADRIYGKTGRDHLNGGPRTDYLSSGSGNDTINAAFGADRIKAGSGRDYVNVATAGPAAHVDCGADHDKVRANRNERRHIHRCETRYMLADR